MFAKYASCQILWTILHILLLGALSKAAPATISGIDHGIEALKPHDRTTYWSASAGDGRASAEVLWDNDGKDARLTLTAQDRFPRDRKAITARAAVYYSGGPPRILETPPNDKQPVRTSVTSRFNLGRGRQDITRVVLTACVEEPDGSEVCVPPQSRDNPYN